MAKSILERLYEILSSIEMYLRVQCKRNITLIVMNTILRAFPFSLIVKFDSFPIPQLSFLSPFASLV